MECHGRAGIGRRRAGCGDNMRAPQAAQFRGKIGLRLHEYAGPAGLLELPALRPALRLVRAHLDEETLTHRREKLRLELFFELVGKHGTHRSKSSANAFAYFARPTSAAFALSLLSCATSLVPRNAGQC